MKTKQWQEMKNLSVTEMEAKLRDSKEHLFRMKFRHSSTPVKNPLEIRTLRRTIAKLNTLLHDKELSAIKEKK